MYITYCFFSVLYLLLLRVVDATRKATCNGWTLKAPLEGFFKCTPAGVTIAMPGTRCLLECDSGYKPKHEVHVCSETGGWIPTNTPICYVDSTMTLVIVLSIVGSIILIFSLSVLYARSSKRCRGSRRKLEDDDPESGARRKDIIVNNVDYYGRIKRLKKKRRLQAESQRALRQMQLHKTVSKQPTSRSKEDKKKNSKSKRLGKKRSLSEMGTHYKSKDEIRLPKKTKHKKEEDGDKLKTVRAFFCALCNACSARKKNSDTISAGKLQNKRVFSVPAPQPAQKAHHLSSSSSSESSSYTSTTSSDPSSSSDSSSSGSDKEEKPTTPQKIEKVDKEKTVPGSKSIKPPVKPPPPKYTKKPPPRPPAPKVVPKPYQKRDSHCETSDSPNSERAVKNRKKAMSSGYSSESDWNKRKGRSDRRNHNKVRSADSKAAKQMEISLKEGDEASGSSGNPYEHYPVALSYRQYQDFENDYRRTTGDYHPQYSNVQLIPIQSAKKSVDKQKTEPEIMPKVIEKLQEESKETSTQEKQDIGKEMKKLDTLNVKGLGGVKYITISEEEEEDEYEELSKSKRTRRDADRNFRRRYDDPAERDKRRHSPDYNPQRRAAAQKATRGKGKEKERTHKKETVSKRDRKREIEDERIINADSNAKRQRKDENNENVRGGRERHKERKSADRGKRHPTTSRKKKDF